jgi:hypothetical protein
LKSQSEIGNREFFMPDPAEQLQQIYLAGFEIETFERFPKCVGVVRDNWGIAGGPASTACRSWGHRAGVWGK